MSETKARRAPPVRPGHVDRHVAARMRGRRVLLGLTQKQLAQLLGVSWQQAHKYETAQNRLSAAMLFRLAKALGVSVGYFFEGLPPTGDPAGPVEDPRLHTLLRHAAALPTAKHQEVFLSLARLLASDPSVCDCRGARRRSRGRRPIRPVVLIVDDEIAVAVGIASTLASAGYAVAGICASGEEAEAFVAAHRCPDLVVMDVRLSGAMDGVAAVEALRRHCPDLPVLFHTACHYAELQARVAELPAVGLLERPSTDGRLLAAASRLLEP